MPHIAALRYQFLGFFPDFAMIYTKHAMLKIYSNFPLTKCRLRSNVWVAYMLQLL